MLNIIWKSRFIYVNANSTSVCRNTSDQFADEKHNFITTAFLKFEVLVLFIAGEKLFHDFSEIFMREISAGMWLSSGTKVVKSFSNVKEM